MPVLPILKQKPEAGEWQLYDIVAASQQLDSFRYYSYISNSHIVKLCEYTCETFSGGGLAASGQQLSGLIKIFQVFKFLA